VKNLPEDPASHNFSVVDMDGPTQLYEGACPVTQKLESWEYLPACDRQTDRQTVKQIFEL